MPVGSIDLGFREFPCMVVFHFLAYLIVTRAFLRLPRITALDRVAIDITDTCGVCAGSVRWLEDNLGQP